MIKPTVFAVSSFDNSFIQRKYSLIKVSINLNLCSRAHSSAVITGTTFALNRQIKSFIFPKNGVNSLGR